MKSLITLLLICSGFAAYSQTRELVILDSITREPVDLVQIFYPGMEIGSITNADGKIRIPVREQPIKISHINYFEKEIPFEDFQQSDTLMLVPKTNELDEVVLYNLDLKKTFRAILENSFSEKYLSSKVLHKTTYKEVFSVNDTLTRLFQVQLDWSSKNSRFDTQKPIEKQNVFNLTSIDYSKIKEINDDLINSRGAYLDTKLFFQYAHLDFLLRILIDFTDGYEITSLQKSSTTNTVFFNASLSHNGTKLYDHDHSLIVFSKDYSTIKYMNLNMKYRTDFEAAVSKRSKIPYEKKTKNHRIELSFKKLSSDKYAIGYFTSELKGVIKTEKYTDQISSKQSLFIVGSELGKRIRKGNIDLNQPFHENLPENLTAKGVKILVTQKEKRFLEE